MSNLFLGDYVPVPASQFPDPDGIQAVKLEGTQTYVFTGQATIHDAWGHAPILTGRFRVKWEDMKRFDAAMSMLAKGPKK